MCHARWERRNLSALDTPPFLRPRVQAFARLDGIVTMVDAKHIEQHLDEVKPEGAENEAIEQVRDRV